MSRKPLMAALLIGITSVAFGFGRKPGDGQDIQPVQRGSAANPNAAYSAPSWSYTAPQNNDPTASKRTKTKSSAATRKTVPDSPAPASDAFPDYATPQTAKSGQPLSKDSIEPPLPDEPGGNLDKKPSFK
jgi:hypothetical protein